MNNTWQNRIVAHSEEAPDQLLASEKNWRIHPKNQQEPLHAALETIGWIQDIIVNVRSGEEWPPEERNVQTVVDGHLRITLALRHDQPSVPVKYVDLSPSEEALALATLDPLAALAGADNEKLDALLRELPPVDVRLQEMLGKLGADVGLYKTDPFSLWQGMPEADNENPGNKPYQSLIIHFQTQEDVTEFSSLIDQPLTNKTKSLWYPAKERENIKSFIYDGRDDES